jgi:hypothetical protein
VAVAHAQHGSVVAGTDQHVLALLEDGRQLVDERELTHVGQGRVRGECHAAHPTRYRPSGTYRHP